MKSLYDWKLYVMIFTVILKSIGNQETSGGYTIHVTGLVGACNSQDQKEILSSGS